MAIEYDFFEKCVTVKNILKDYSDIRDKCQMKYVCNEESIKNYSKPFLAGYFTLAIVGKMNTDKYILINELIGTNILPTGIFQAPSSVTYIEHSENPALKVIFSDEHIEEFEGDTINQELIRLTSIPIEYRELPIYEINRLISANCSARDILKKKEEIEMRTNCPKFSKDLWLKYIEEHPHNTVVKEVHIQIPLCENFLGWRIIDIPDIESIKDIQDEAKNFHGKADGNKNKSVDAIIFYHCEADNIKDEQTKTFFQNNIKRLTPETRQRVFFILKQSSKEDFRLRKKEIMSTAFSLYGTPYNIPRERFTYVDCLLHRFCDDIRKYNCDISMIEDESPLPGWDEKEWKSMSCILDSAKQEIRKEGKESSNETILEKYHLWSNFAYLSKAISLFVSQVIKIYFDNFFTLVYHDINVHIDYYSCWIDFFNKRNEEMECEKEALNKSMATYFEERKLIKERITLIDFEINIKKDSNKVQKKEYYLHRLKFLEDTLAYELKNYTALEKRERYYSTFSKMHYYYCVYLLEDFRKFLNERFHEYDRPVLT